MKTKAEISEIKKILENEVIKRDIIENEKSTNAVKEYEKMLKKKKS